MKIHTNINYTYPVLDLCDSTDTLAVVYCQAGNQLARHNVPHIQLALPPGTSPDLKT